MQQCSLATRHNVSSVIKLLLKHSAIKWQINQGNEQRREIAMQTIGWFFSSIGAYFPDSFFLPMTTRTRRNFVRKTYFGSALEIIVIINPGGRGAQASERFFVENIEMKPFFLWSKLFRFSTSEQAAKNRIQNPARVLHYYFAPLDFDEERMKEVRGLQEAEPSACRSQKCRSELVCCRWVPHDIFWKR